MSKSETHEFQVEGCVFRGTEEDEERIRAAAREAGGWVPSAATVGVFQRGLYRDGEEFWYRNGEEYRMTEETEEEALARVDALLMEASDIMAGRPVKSQPYACVRLGRELHEMRRDVQRRLNRPVTVLSYIYPAPPYDRCPSCGEDRGRHDRAEHRCGT